jgi:hypothetical protein
MRKKAETGAEQGPGDGDFTLARLIDFARRPTPPPNQKKGSSNMHVKTIFAGIMAFATVSGAYAQTDNTFTGTSPGNWNTGGNWSLGHVPTSAERAVVPSNKVVNLNVASSTTIGHMSVSGQLNIPAGKLLAVDGVSNGSGNGVNRIDGTVVLQGSASQLQFTSMNQRLEDNSTGNGLIKFEDPNAELLIDNGLTITNEIAFMGKGRIRATSGIATLNNKQISTTVGAVIVANDSGVLELDSSLVLAETKFTQSSVDYWPQYRADTSSSAVLRFSYAAASTALDGDFFIDDCAKFEIVGGADVFTSGSLRMSDGHVDVDCSSQFEWQGTGGETPIGPISCTVYDAGSC